MKKLNISTKKYPNTFALVDDNNFEELNKYKWYLSKRGYVIRNSKDKKTIRMHREIMNAAKGIVVDHINHNTLDNRKYNLRICTYAENMRNQYSVCGASKYKGVSKFKNQWMARITYKYKLIYLGIYTNEKDAASAYDKKAKELYGEFAYLNKIGD